VVVSIAVMTVTLVAGLLVRFVPLGLPRFVVKYGGSTMWAAMIYWVVSAGLPRVRVVPLAVVSGSIATAVEFVKLWRSPGLDAFRGTLPGVLLLGRHFSGWDILAYWLAIGLGAAMDMRLLRARRGR
jgi:hypothetical protein